MIHPWGKDRFVPAPEEQPDGAVGSRRPHFAERNTEVAGGGERHRGHGTSSGRALAGWERSFFISASPSLEGAAAQGAKGNSHPDGRLTFPAERPLPQSGASRKPGTAAGRGGRPHRPENAKPFRKPEAGDRPASQPPPAEEGAQPHPRPLGAGCLEPPSPPARGNRGGAVGGAEMPKPPGGARGAQGEAGILVLAETETRVRAGANKIGNRPPQHPSGSRGSPFVGFAA